MSLPASPYPEWRQYKEMQKDGRHNEGRHDEERQDKDRYRQW